MKDTAILESVAGAFMIHTHQPGGKELDFVWKKADDGKYVCEVPLRIEHKHQSGKIETIHENFPQFLLNNYKHLRLVKVKKAPIVVQPEIVDPNVPKEEAASIKKGKQQ